MARRSRFLNDGRFQSTEPSGRISFADGLERHQRHSEILEDGRLIFQAAASDSSQHRPRSARSQRSGATDDEYNVSAGAPDTSCMEMSEFHSYAKLHIRGLICPEGDQAGRLREITERFPLSLAGFGNLGSPHSSVYAYSATWQELESEGKDGKDVVAVKRVKYRSGEEKAAARAEINNLASLRHNHVVALVDSFVHTQLCHIVMYPAAKFDLAKYLRDITALAPSCHKEHQAERSQRLEDVRRFFSCLCSALQYLHEKLPGIKMKHKDIKPGNILVDRFRNVLITDFGISKQYARDEGSNTFSTLGTHMYAAPEIIGNSTQKGGLKIDHFSLGCVFMEMATILSGYSVEQIREHFMVTWKLDCGNGEQTQTRVTRYGLCNTRKLQEWTTYLRAAPSSGTALSNNQLAGIQRMMSGEPDERPTLREMWDLFRSLRERNDECPCASDWKEIPRLSEMDVVHAADPEVSSRNPDTKTSDQDLSVMLPQSVERVEVTVEPTSAGITTKMPEMTVSVFDHFQQRAYSKPVSAISGKRIFIYDEKDNSIVCMTHRKFDWKQKGMFLRMPRSNGWRYRVMRSDIDLWSMATFRQNMSRVAGSTRYLFARGVFDEHMADVGS